MIPAAAFAQSRASISVAAMPLKDALEEIGRQSGKPVDYDPSAVPGLQSVPVRAAANAEAAVRQAISGTSLTVTRQSDGALVVGNDIVVTARRDEAETSILVRQNSTSNRNGTTLRDQPRNTQVVSSALIDEQQATSVRDALRYAGGISAGIDGSQGQGTFQVRGFAVAPLTNGLPGAGSRGNLGGAGGNIDTIERIEVLKGPDALLSGSGNLGGVINVVTKKPSADFFTEVSSELGINFGDVRVTGDINGAVTADDRVSARLIGSFRDGDVNYGGYRAANNYTVAPSLRYKDASTDIILSATLTDEFIATSPYVLYSADTGVPFDFRRDQPILTRDQGFNIQTQQYLVDASHKVTQNITAVARYQHVYSKTRSDGPTLLGAFSDGSAFVSTDNDQQSGPTDAFDGYVRARFRVGPVRNTLNVGFTYVNSTANTRSASGFYGRFNLLTGDPATIPARPTDLTPTSKNSFTQKGYYAQNLMEVGPVHVVAGIRRTDFKATNIAYPYAPFGVTEETRFNSSDSATTPSAGIVIDVMRNLSVFANYLEGFEPTYSVTADGTRLPNVRSKNKEGGIKLDLFGKAGVLNLSYFQNNQSNIIRFDPVTFDPFAAPGQRAEGIDVNLSGQILRGWTVIASYTRTKYRNLADEFADFNVIGNPRDTYSAYTNYSFKLGREATAALGAGITGRSSAFASSFGDFVSPPARQVDVNAAIQVHGINVRLGVRNLLNRRNFDVSFSESRLPISEPRNVRLTAGYRF
ncbi:TonB-dependent siderophore receptor [Sphingomonas montana]|uniref:TonB-dependent siderophore receptor n=1 Tax=Sphingomonas montana TaxID=1843236 RepID=UPI0013ED23B3|nr:TonB-dependent receptor [Sphingomonas montana]